MIYKTVWFLRRNPAMTREEFVEYYETKHSKLVAHFDGVVKYFRRYPVQRDGEFDVMMELWFESQQAFDASHERDEADEAFWEAAVEDEKKLFDYGADGWRTMVVIDVEHETDLSSPSLETTYERGIASSQS